MRPTKFQKMDVRKRERDDSFVLEEELLRPLKKRRLAYLAGSDDGDSPCHDHQSSDEDDDEGSLQSLLYSDEDDDESCLFGLTYVDDEEPLGSFFDHLGRRRSRRISRMTPVSYVGMC